MSSAELLWPGNCQGGLPPIGFCSVNETEMLAENEKLMLIEKSPRLISTLTEILTEAAAPMRMSS